MQALIRPASLGENFWSRRKLEPVSSLALAGSAQTHIIVDYVIGQQLLATGRKPLVVRGGGFSFNMELLEELEFQGIAAHSGLAPHRWRQPLWLNAEKPFRWSNGVLEIPLSRYPDKKRKWREVSLDNPSITSLEAFRAAIGAFHATAGEDALAVITMHSWSLLSRSGGKWRMDQRRGEMFLEILEDLGGTHDVLTTGDVVKLADAGELAMGDGISLDSFDDPAHARAVRFAPRNPREAMELEWARNPADLSARAEKIWYDGSGKPDYGKAVTIFAKAYNLGDHELAAYFLGQAYYYGLGVDRDFARALNYLTSPELENHGGAHFVLSRLFADTAFEQHDLRRALEEMQRARELGVRAAQEEARKLRKRLRDLEISGEKT